MAHELDLQTAPIVVNANAQAVIRNESGQVWNGTAFVTFTDANVNTYKVPLSEQDDSGFYTGDFPSGVTTAGTYTVVVYNQAGGSLVVTDTIIGFGDLVWDGSAEADAQSGTTLVSLASIKNYLGLQDTATFDVLIYQLSKQASEVVTGYCRRTSFIKHDVTEYLDGPDDYTLQLQEYPLIAITSVTLNPYSTQQFTFDNTYTNVIDTKTGQFRVQDLNGVPRWFGDGWNKIKVIYSAGYQVIPDDLQMCVTQIVKNLYIQRGTEQITSMEKIGDYQATYSRAQQIIDADFGIRQVLNRYKSLTN